jgi:uncharacterized membrane protein
MISVILYGRKECHLCEQVQEDLNSLQEKIPHQLTVIDIESNDDMNRAYAFEIPVVEVGPYKLKAPFSKQELEVTLAAAVTRKKQLEDLKDPEYSKMVNRGKTWGRLDAFSYWLSKHYLALFNVSVFVYIAITFVAPVFMKFGLVVPANIIYRGYKVVCHQLAYRSFFLFGEQPFYPRAAAGLDGLLTFQETTGLSEGNYVEDIIAAEKFTGNDIVGYKVALCERDISIYAGILLFGLFFGATRKHFPSLPWYLWIIIGLAPIGLDGTSQLISQPPFNFIPYRESTPYLRMITGALFGISTAWFGYPLLEESMADTRKILAIKRLRLKNHRENQVDAVAK